ncbi:MAG: NAD+ synthase [Deltaproteobacteria bacterium RBG_13_52_11]|nr:MAG: NAD+ synthase [Deltaproteobacteria bacterium RBG_13_52_11]
MEQERIKSIRIALAQINATVGDLEGNARRIEEGIQQARELGVDLLAFPELAITGYPPEDLLLMPRFVQQNLKILGEIAKGARGLTVLVGFVDKKDDIYNAAALIHNGELADVYHKVFLPNYSVFDEDRYFQAGREALVFELQGVKIGVSICEDIWHAGDPLKTETVIGDAEVVINISASPFHAGKRDARQRIISSQASDNAVIIAYVNLVGGQDELVFDGNSMIINPRGELIARAHSLAEDLLVADVDVEEVFRARLHDPRRRKEKQTLSPDHIPLKTVRLAEVKKKAAPLPPLESNQPIQYDGAAEIYQALVVGTLDYVRKNGFQKVFIGLSGGIDSAIVAAIAVDALGNENVTGVAMPSPYSSEESLEDAQQLADNLGITLLRIPISSILDSYLETIKPLFHGMREDSTEENIQARIRGNILMALANKFGALVLATGNKSELSTGYCTLYGDMAGGFAVIRDCPKTLVYQLADHKNKKEGKDIIPIRVIKKEPTAELRPNQKDTDTLPPYELLDPILLAYVEEDKGADEIVALGYSPEIVREVIDRVDRNEYKRRQGPPGIKITPRALGKDRRLPITNRYRNF